MLNKKIIIIIILILAVIFVGVMFWCFKKQPDKQVVQDKKEQKVEEQKIEEVATTIENIDVSDWKVYRNEEYGFEIGYPKEWGDIKEKVELASYIHPKNLVLNFSNFPGKKIYINFINNCIKFITNKFYDNYIKNNTPSFHKGRYEALEDIYKNKSVTNYSIDKYNAGSASYALFNERPFIPKYIESNNQNYRGMAYYTGDVHHDIMVVSHTYSVILINNKGNIVDMFFVLNDEYFNDLNISRNKEIEEDIKKNNNIVDMDRIKIIINKWEGKYKERFNNLIVADDQFKIIIDSINLIVKNLK